MIEKKQNEQADVFVQILDLYSQINYINIKICNMNLLSEHPNIEIENLYSELTKNIDKLFIFVKELSYYSNDCSIADYSIHNILLDLKSVIENSDITLKSAYKQKKHKEYILLNELLKERDVALNNLSKICNGVIGNQNLFWDYSNLENDFDEVLKVYLDELFEKVKSKNEPLCNNWQYIARNNFNRVIDDYVERKMDESYCDINVKCTMNNVYNSMQSNYETYILIMLTVLEFFKGKGISVTIV